jgi:hypothetical protein
MEGRGRDRVSQERALVSVSGRREENVSERESVCETVRKHERKR